MSVDLNPPRQLALGVGLNAGLRFSNFVTGANAAAVEAIKAALGNPCEPLYYLWGAAASGKTHLLQASCAEAAVVEAVAAYVPLSDASLSPAMLEDLEAATLVCLDDVQAVAGRRDWEEALFHLYNRIDRRRAGGHRCALLVTSNAPPAGLEHELADLRSRLSAGVTYHLQALSDDGLVDALKLRARERGFELPDEVAGYLLRRERREMAHLMALLDTLDKSTLEAKRRLTVPFVRDLMKSLRM